jgi:glycerophosphoryl diester phosphodiesterase
MTLIVAHRGASAYETENSLAAFRMAHAMGADGIELDIHVTADGVPIVHHDPTIDGMAIRRTPLGAVRERCRLGNGEPVPTLAEALVAIDATLQVYVEVKALAGPDDRHVLAVLRESAHPDRCQVHSFDHRIVQRLRASEPSLVIGVLSASYPVHPVAALQDVGASTLWQQESLVDAELAIAAHAVGARLFAWTVDDPVRMRTLRALGVDAVCTNRPDLARDAIG